MTDSPLFSAIYGTFRKLKYIIQSAEKILLTI